MPRHDHDDDLPPVPGIDDDDCGPATESDAVDEALDGLIELLVDNGYDDEIAEEAVFDAMEGLTTAGMLTDTPELDEPDEVKRAWIVDALPRLRLKLRDMGLDFTEEA